MEQHPVPQQISSYQFKLVGDMTLKQFFEVAGGVVIGLIIYSLPLPVFLKWPFIIIFVLLGAALAFLPIEERPLEQWLMAFIRSIYQPTKFFWKKSEVPVQYFLQPSAPKPAQETSDISSSPAEAPKAAFVSNLEAGEKAFFSNFTRLFSGGGAAPTPAPAPATAVVVNPQPAQPEKTWAPVQNSAASNTQPEVIITPTPTPKTTQETPPPQPSTLILDTKHMTQPNTTPQTSPEPKKVVIPTLQAVTVEKSKEPVPQVAPIQASPVNIKTEAINQILPNQPVKVSAPVSTQFSPEAAPPAVPTQVNIVVGQIMDNQGKIVEGAILEIKDMQGRPVRALKSNRVGHFFIVTPLTNGQYQLTVEKEGLEFIPMSVDAKGEILQPIAIRAK